MVQFALLVDPQREPADEVGVGDDDPFGAAVGDLELGLDGVGAPHDPRDHSALDVLDVAVERKPRDRRQRRQDPEEDRHRPHKRQHPVALGLLPEQLLELLELLRMLSGDVARLGEVVR